MGVRPFFGGRNVELYAAEPDHGPDRQDHRTDPEGDQRNRSDGRAGQEDPDRAQFALDRENAGDEPRKTLVDKLEKLV